MSKVVIPLLVVVIAIIGVGTALEFSRRQGAEILQTPIQADPVDEDSLTGSSEVEESASSITHSDGTAAIAALNLLAKLGDGVEKPGPAAGMIPTGQAIELIQGRIEKNPNDFVSMTILGQLWLRHAKESDDHAGFVKAEQSFRRAIEQQRDAKAAQVHLIEALQSQHKFREALEQSRIALEVVPGNLVAIASQGDAEMELGNLNRAEKAFQQVAAKVQTPGTLARMARLAELKGDSQQAIETIKAARKLSVQYGERNRTTAWYDFRLGFMLLSTGEVGAAKQAFEAGLKRMPDDVRCLNGMAKVLVAEGRLEAAEATYRKSLDLEDAPPINADLGDLLDKLGRRDEAEQLWDKAEMMMAEEAETTGVAHYRERALFLLNHDRQIELALELTRKDLEIRQDIYSHDAHAWALYKNGQFQAALESAEQALATNVSDALVYYHAGMIASAAGETTLAQSRLEKALSINPFFDLNEAQVAKDKLKELAKSD